MESLIDKIFMELDGKFCRVKSGNIYVEPSIEMEVLLSYRKFYGLEIHSKIGKCWYSKDLFTVIKENIEKDYENSNKEIGIYTIYDLFAQYMPIIYNHFIRIGLIGLYNTINIETFYNKDKQLTQVVITNAEKFKTEIRVCSENYNELQYQRLLNE